MPEHLRAFSPALSKREQQLLKMEPPDGRGSAREDLHTTSPYASFLDSLFFKKSLATLNADNPEEPPTLEKGILQKATLRGCEDKARMEARDHAHQDKMRAELDALVDKAGFKRETESVMGLYADRKPEYGYTYVVCIGQSNVAIHTYPQRGTVTVTVDVCSGEMQKIEKDGEDMIQRFFDLTQQFYQARRFRTPEDTEEEGLSEIGPRQESLL